MVYSLYGGILKRKWLTLQLCLIFIQGITQAQDNGPRKSFHVSTYNNLSLPAQIIESQIASNKLIIFIKGSTPYDEKVHQVSIWNNKGEPFLEKVDFYQRFSEVMPLKGYTQATDLTFPIHYAAMVWIGHHHDLKNNREEAISWYKMGLEHYPGIPVQHDNWGMKIDSNWIQERLKTPFRGVKQGQILIKKD